MMFLEYPSSDALSETIRKLNTLKVFGRKQATCHKQGINIGYIQIVKDRGTIYCDNL
jgi:formamidopyrimidine-DNA glycosylase